MLISQVKWKEFSEKEKSILLKAAKDSLNFQKKLWAEQSTKELELMKKSGVKVINVDKKPFQDGVQPMYEKLNWEMRKLVKEIRNTNDTENLIDQEPKK
jgi:TRAP-type C4-dicarboxylate transport system substrate-binding protein